MTSVAAVVAWNGVFSSGDAFDLGVIDSLKSNTDVRDVALVVPADQTAPPGQHTVLPTASLWSRQAVVDALRWFKNTGATYLLWLLSPAPKISTAGFKRLVDCACDTNAALVYSDYVEQEINKAVRIHPLIDYEPGSLRDDFDFGPVLLLRGEPLVDLASQIEQQAISTAHGGWYDLRLRLSELGPIVHLPEPTYTIPAPQTPTSGEAQFNYVDPRNREYQIEMEQIATAHLKRIGAFLQPPCTPLAAEQSSFPVEASVIIPVRNRQRTVADAVESALSQQTPFELNVIVVDNHSDDGTTQILAGIARSEPRLVHVTPTRIDLGIGGCWNEAIHEASCGRYAVQLDSDDLYAGPDVLLRVVAEFQRTGCAMVIGSYSIVDFDLNPIPPGLVDHREWTNENGHNNALRIAGLGAPRAFHVPTLRTIGFPNTSFGEDYAVGLRLSRSYPIGRIYDSLYWCRRWEDNTDHALALETSNRYAAFKDRLRTIEIAARQRIQQAR